MKVLIYEYLSIISPRFECCVHTKKISLNRNGPNTLLYSYHGSDLACFCAFFELKLSTWSHVLIKPSRGARPSSAQRTVLAGMLRMCVVTGLALVTLLLMTTKPGTLGPHVATDISSQVTGNGSGERRELCTVWPLSASFPLGLIVKCEF